MGGKVRETSPPQCEEHNGGIAGCSGYQRVAQTRAPNLAEAIRKESFARHMTLNKPRGPRIGKEGDGSRYQELIKARKPVGPLETKRSKAYV